MSALRTAKPYLISVLLIAGAAIGAAALQRIVSIEVISLFFVPVVLVAAINWGLVPALFAAALTICVARFFFYAPIYDFDVDDPMHVVDLAIFTAVAAFAGPLADRARRSALTARQREARMKQLYDISRALAAVADTSSLPAHIVQEAARIGGGRCCLLLPQGGELAVAASTGEKRMSELEMVVPRHLWQSVMQQGDVPQQQAFGEWVLHVIRHGSRPAGLLATGREWHIPEDDRVFLAALLELFAGALERMHLAARIEQARVDEKADALREAIIDSISHDLRTPLAGILGSATTLEKFGSLCSEAERSELVMTIRGEAERLDRFIGKLVDLTRIRSGRLQPLLEAFDLVDVVEVALRQSRASLAGHRIDVQLPGDLPMPQGDAVLLEQALVNILENAAKYSPDGSTITVAAEARPDHVALRVQDTGRGLTPGQSAQIFNQFYRVADGGAGPDGSGLGLAISRAFIEACGGTIAAESRGAGQGTTISILLPVADRPLARLRVAS